MGSKRQWFPQTVEKFDDTAADSTHYERLAFIVPMSLSCARILTHHTNGNFSMKTGCCIFSGTELSACFYDSTYGNLFWTAGQRIDPNRNSPFIWRVKSTDTYSETVSQMSYTNWNTSQPNYYSQAQSCVHLYGGISYKWDDVQCSVLRCSVCEFDNHKHSVVSVTC